MISIPNFCSSIGQLKCAVDIPLLSLPAFPKALNATAMAKNGHWIKNVLNPFRPVVFADTDGIKNNEFCDTPGELDAISPLEHTVSRQARGTVVNDTEAALVREIVKGLVIVGVPPSSIGVICPFNAQVCLPELDECEYFFASHLTHLILSIS